MGLKVATENSVYTGGYDKGQVITVPIAHHDGNYNVDDDNLARLKGEDRIAFTYTDNPNGSVADIAGILSENRRVLGMMPHPERMAEAAHGNTEGATLFSNVVNQLVHA